MKINLEDFRNNGGLNTIDQDSIDDVFITSISFEERCQAVTTYIKSNYKAKLGIVIYNQELIMEESTSCNENMCIDVCKTSIVNSIQSVKEHLGLVVEKVVEEKSSYLDTRTQVLVMKDISKQISEMIDKEKDIRISIDITTFNRDQLITLLYYLKSNFASLYIRTIYVSPQNHGSWLTKGYKTIRNVIGFPGSHKSSLPTLLVVLSGFEPERIERLIDEHEPTKVLLGIGDPPTKVDFLSRNISLQKFILDKQSVDGFKFSANAINECKNTLEKMFEQYCGNYNIILAPMSTKLSTVAAFLAIESYPEIQITYCVPSEYNYKSYSDGMEDIFIDLLITKHEE